MNTSKVIKILTVVCIIFLTACQKNDKGFIYKESDSTIINSKGDKISAVKMKNDKGILLPNAMPMRFYHIDGKGDWQTTISVKSREGSFGGAYSEDSKEKNVRISRFFGKFGNIKKTSSYTYSMSLDKIELKNQIGEEWDEQGTHYIACEPHGLKSGKIFTLYTSEMPMQKFCKEFSEQELKKWFSDYSTKERKKGLLSRFVLINIETRDVFITDRVLMRGDIQSQKRNQKIKLSVKKSLLKIGEKEKITLGNANLVKGNVKWKTSKKGVIGIYKSNKNQAIIQAKRTGSAVITAIYKKKKYTCKFVIKNKVKKEKDIPIKRGMLPIKFFFTQSGEEYGTFISITGRNGLFKGVFTKSKTSQELNTNFFGRFGNVKKLNEYSYSMTLKKLTLENSKSEKGNKKVPYGLSVGEKFILYMPNTPMSVIKKKYKNYLSWLPYYDIPENSKPEFLSCYGLHNNNIGYGYYTKK